MTVRVAVDRDVCVGAGNCVLAAPTVFDQDDDGIVQLVTAVPSVDQEDDVRTAMNRCPSGAILVD